MKRKRAPTNEITRARSFQSREELLNECLSLTLKYNIEFGYPATDLTLYRHGENIESLSELAVFVKKMGESIASREELTSI